MVTGIETAGLVLAVFPIVVQVIDIYADGLRKIHRTSARQHRRDLQLHAFELGSQKAMFIELLTRLLEDVAGVELVQSNSHVLSRGTVTEVSIDLNIEAIQHVLERRSVQDRIRERLGKTYQTYVDGIELVYELLHDLEERIGSTFSNEVLVAKELVEILRNAKGPTKAKPANSHYRSILENIPVAPERLLKRVSRLRTIFAEPSYQRLITTISSVNRTLAKLTKHAKSRQSQQKHSHSSGTMIHNCYRVRTLAKAVYERMVLEQDWITGSKYTTHSLGLHLDDTVSSLLVEDRTTQYLDNGPDTFKIQFRCDPDSVTGPGDIAITCRTRYTFSVTADTMSRVVETQTSDCKAFEELDVCSVLSGCLVSMSTQPKRTNEEIKKLTVENRSFKINLHRTGGEEQEEERFQTLQEKLRAETKANTSLPSWPWGQRLRLALTLAMGVFLHHGTWLSPSWQTEEILLAAERGGNSANGKSNTNAVAVLHALPPSPVQRRAQVQWIRSSILFPLGLVLAELAFSRTLDTLKLPEDVHQDEQVTHHRTVTRLLDSIESSIGYKYMTVVQSCISWPGKRHASMDDEEFQSDMFDKVIRPLSADLAAFEGPLR